MEDRVGQVWEVTTYVPGRDGPLRAVVAVVRSCRGSALHRCLVLDADWVGWKAGDLVSHGEFAEWPNERPPFVGPRRLA